METTIKLNEKNSNTGEMHQIDIELELRQKAKGKEFSASCGVWDAKKYDMIIAGQAFDSVLNEFPQLKHSDLFTTIYDLWSKYHLNGMNAGTPEQEEITSQLGSYSYDDAKELLIEHNMLGVPHPENPDKTYVYGTEWLFRPIPPEDLETIEQIIENN